ncbi:MAG: hypothetical protein ACK4SZ_13845 [Allosphingosinicella sp.]|uniref:hypothetical protein n=1 Tax=Allosphingosinicella sp. TaxID=2823234 RepID=UPI0039522E21
MPEAQFFQPDLQEFLRVFRALAVAGIGEAVTQRMPRRLPQKLVRVTQFDANVAQFELTAPAVRGSFRPRFYPMPAAKHGDFAFWAASPLFSIVDEENYDVDFQIVLWSGERHSASGHTIGLRFERAGDRRSTHRYPHLQLTQTFRTPYFATNASWLPSSYPAFPTKAETAIDHFTAALLAAYGVTELEDQQGKPPKAKRGVAEVLRRKAVTDWLSADVIAKLTSHVEGAYGLVDI